MYKATANIYDYFVEQGIKCHTVDHDEVSLVEAGFPVDGGPLLIARFFSCSDSNSVALRIYGIIHNIREDRVLDVYKLLSEIHSEDNHFGTFYLDEDRTLNFKYNLPAAISDDCLGEAAFELFLRTAASIIENYSRIIQAIHNPDSGQPRNDIEEFKMLIESAKAAAAKKAREEDFLDPLGEDFFDSLGIDND